jgi:hypothetical protein
LTGLDPIIHVFNIPKFGRKTRVGGSRMPFTTRITIASLLTGALAGCAAVDGRPEGPA